MRLLAVVRRFKRFHALLTRLFPFFDCLGHPADHVLAPWRLVLTLCIVLCAILERLYMRLTAVIPHFRALSRPLDLNIYDSDCLGHPADHVLAPQWLV